jgi:DNA repair exonuclease SbcCD ATPase subunit
MSELKERYLKVKSLKETYEKRASALDSEIAFLESDLDLKTQASGVLDTLAQKEVEEGVKTYVSLLEEGLRAIFPEQEISQEAEIVKIRNKISVRLKTIVKGSDGLLVEGEGLDTFGGAVSTVQSLLLRVSLILKRDLRPLLILDETFPAVDGGRTDLLVDFLKALCKRLEMDILCISHNASIADNADVAYRISSSSKGAVFTKIT